MLSLSLSLSLSPGVVMLPAPLLKAFCENKLCIVSPTVAVCVYVSVRVSMCKAQSMRTNQGHMHSACVFLRDCIPYMLCVFGTKEESRRAR